MTTVKEMRAKLVESGMSKSAAAELNKTECKDAIEKLKQIESVVEIKDQDEISDQQEKRPYIYEPDWTEWLKAQLQSTEMDSNGYPRVDGLRRLAHLILGQFSSETEIKQVPNFDNGYRATAVVTISFPNIDGLSTRRFSGSADCFNGNADRMFAKFPVAMAETRAEGRALRKALGLTGLLCAEEITDDTEEASIDTSEDKITASLINALKHMATSGNINFDAFLKHIKVENIEELTIKQGRDLSKRMRELKESKDGIPKELRIK